MESASKVMVIVMIFAVMLLLAKEAEATKHTVGGSQGWDESTDFNSWASTQIFKVGDQLGMNFNIISTYSASIKMKYNVYFCLAVFKYTPGLHSVVELEGKPAYEKCDISTALDSKSSASGEDIVKLTKPGTRYFACGTLGHCSGGMKLKINVVASTSSSSSTTPESSDEPPSSSTSTDDTSSTTSATSDAPIHLKDYSLLVILILAFINICSINA